MLGAAVSRELAQRNVAAFRLVRRASQPVSSQNGTEMLWNPAAGELDIAALGRAGRFVAAVHLSGANVSGRRWTESYKREMWTSRVDSTRVLAESLAKLKNPPPVLVAASAVGFYGNRGDEILDEDSPAGRGFFPELCAAWEAAAQPAVEAGIRVVHVRLGVVLSARGGALAKLLPIFRLGLGGPLGDGRAWMSWLGEADAVRAILFAAENPLLSGAVNMVAPQPVTNAEFTRALGRAVHRPALIPAPAFALRIAFGQMADEALLASTRVLPKRLSAAGFSSTRTFGAGEGPARQHD